MKNYILKIIVTTSLITLTACGGATKVEEFNSPSGAAIKSIKGNKSANELFMKATQVCGGKYKVIDSERHAGGLVADILPGPVTWYVLTVECGKSGGKEATFPFRGQTYTAPPVIYTPPARNVIVNPGPTTTYCNRIGSSVTCNSY